MPSSYITVVKMHFKIHTVAVNSQYIESKIIIQLSNPSKRPPQHESSCPRWPKWQIKAYINLNTKVPESFVYKSKVLEKEGIVICYAIPKELNDWTKKVFPKATISHELAVGLQSIIRDFYSVSEEKVILNVNHFEGIYEF